MAGCRNSLLERLVVLGHVPITEVVIGNMGLAKQDQQHQLPKELASTRLGG